MKRMLRSLAAAMLLAASFPAFAANVTLTPIVPPNETGENSSSAQQVVDMARFKPGTCTVTTTGSSNANSGTCNGASGIVTTNSISIAVTTGSATITITNNKVQTGDMVLAMIDSTGATANSLPDVSSVQVSNNQIIFTLTNTGAATEVANLKIYFLVMSAGNPN